MVELFGFGEALQRIQAGGRCARLGWNGKGMWIFLVRVTGAVDANHLALKVKGAHPCVVMKAADDRLVFGWLASQTDMLAADWMELDRAQMDPA